jgi:hypothetical protein
MSKEETKRKEMFIKRINFYFPDSLKPRVYALGGRVPGAKRDGAGATIQKMELDPTGGVIIYIEPNIIKYINNIPMEVEVIEK